MQIYSDPDGTATCSSTGLNIVASNGRHIYRVAKAIYGPTKPPERGGGDDPVTREWSRWDTPGRTIYGNSTAVGALAEVLEYITPDPPKTPVDGI